MKFYSQTYLFLVDKKNLSVGDMALPSTPTQLFSSIFVKSPDGSAFSPEVGPYFWNLTNLGVVIDVFQMPFTQKKLYRILLSDGGMGWAWDDCVIPLVEASNL